MIRVQHPKKMDPNADPDTAQKNVLPAELQQMILSYIPLLGSVRGIHLAGETEFLTHASLNDSYILSKMQFEKKDLHELIRSVYWLLRNKGHRKQIAKTLMKIGVEVMFSDLQGGKRTVSVCSRYSELSCEEIFRYLYKICTKQVSFVLQTRVDLSNLPDTYCYPDHLDYSLRGGWFIRPPRFEKACFEHKYWTTKDGEMQCELRNESRFPRNIHHTGEYSYRQCILLGMKEIAKVSGEPLHIVPAKEAWDAYDQYMEWIRETTNARGLFSHVLRELEGVEPVQNPVGVPCNVDLWMDACTEWFEALNAATT